MTKRRPLALCAAATIGLGSLFIAAPAMAQDQPADPTVQASAAAADILEAKGDDSVVGYGANTAGEPVVLVNEELAKDADKLDAIAAEHGVTKIALVGNATPDASTDVVAGAGYIGELIDGSGRAGACSIGFTGYNGSGDPAIITAGHCASDGMIDEVELSKPSTDPANGGDGFEGDGNGVIGSFGFYQYGDEGQGPGAENDPTSTDIAVIDVTSDEFDLKAEVTDWSTAGQDDLAASTTVINGVSDPVAGTVSKSGRTTGLNEGPTELELLYTDGNTYPTEILDGWMQIGGKWVHGFLGGALTEGGDSGGAVFQGDQAVGVVSGGPSEAPAQGDDWAWYTRLADALEQVPGNYTVAIHLDAPVVESPSEGATVEPGSDITVSLPSNATEISVSTQPNSGSVEPVENGSYTTQAPEEEGDYTYSFTSVNGFNHSETTELNFSVEDTIAAPTVDSQTLVAAAGDESASGALTGTGIAGAEVKVNDFFETTVGDDGKWELADFSFGVGVNDFTATQTFEGETSPVGATGTVTVAPAAPVIESIAPNQTFANAEAPTEISGTGLEGATTAVTLNGEVVTADTVTTDAAGPWTQSFGSALAAGTYSVEVTQTFNDVTSAPAAVVFTVEAAAVTPPPVDPTPPPVDPTEPAPPQDPSAPTQPGEQLPITGGVNMLPFGLSALGMLVLGGGAIALTARKLNRQA